MIVKRLQLTPRSKGGSYGKRAMDFDITDGIAILERTSRTLHAMVHDLGVAWIDATEGPKRGALTASPAAVGDLGCARLGTYRTNRSRDGETARGRNVAVVRVLANRGPMKWRLS